MSAYRISHYTRPVITLFLALGLTLTLLLVVNSAIPVTRAAGPWYVAPPPVGNDSNACDSEATPCATINAAVAKASAGDTINLAAGTYTENITVAVPLSFAGAGANRTIVDGNLTDRVFNIVSGTVSIADLTIQHGDTTGDGGGIYAADELTLTNVNVLSNTAVRSGGGVRVGRNATIAGGVFQNNQSLTQNGGGLAVDRALTLVGTRFTNNTAKEGGGIYLTGSDGLSSSLANVILDGNTATSAQGNALFAYTETVSLRHGTLASPTLGNGSAIYGDANDWFVYSTLINNYTLGYEQAENTQGWVYEYRTLFSGVITPYVGSNIETDSHSFSGAAGFIDPGSRDYHLTASSEAINRGLDMQDSPVIDFDGNSRLVGCGYDIGAYEYQAAPDCMLTVNVVGSGVVTPAIGIHPYAYGAVVALTASTSAPWGFGGWSGDVNSTANSASVFMLSDNSVTATFVMYRIYLPLTLK